jgi:hypothetical protein
MNMPTVRDDLRTLFAVNTYTTALANKVPVTAASGAVPTCLVAIGSTTSIAGIPVVEYEAIRLVFGGTNAANLIINYQVFGWTRGAGDAGLWVPMLLAKGAATLGALVMTVAGLDTAATYIADTITDTVLLPGTQVRSPADDMMADLTVRPGGCKYLTVETDLNDATAASVYWEALDEVGMTIDPLTEDTFMASSIGKGIQTGAVAINALTVSDDTTVFAASIAIPTGTVAVRFGVNAPCHVYVDATATRIVAYPGKAFPKDWFGDLACVGCTYLHLAKPVGGANVTFEGSWVAAE